MAHDDTEVHAPPADTFVQNFAIVLLLLVAFAFAIAIAAGTATSALMDEKPEPAIVELANKRIAPVAGVHLGAAGSADAVADAGPVDGAEVYASACFSCHATGAAGAPKLGVAADWTARLERGTEVLYQHSIQGFNAMPPKGGFVNLSDEQVQAAVDYMLGELPGGAPDQADGEAGGEASDQAGEAASTDEAGDDAAPATAPVAEQQPPAA